MLDNRSHGKWSWSLSMFAGGRDCEDRLRILGHRFDDIVPLEFTRDACGHRHPLNTISRRPRRDACVIV